MASALASRGAVISGAVVDLDVTSGVFADGTYNFALVTSSADDVVYQSREATTGKPQLIVNLGQNSAPAVQITAPASGFRTNPDVAVHFTARATDADSGDISSRVEWSSSLDGNLGTGGAITAPRLSSGSHTIIARVTDDTGLSGEAQIVVHVGHRPVVRITAPANNAVYAPLATVSFTSSVSGNGGCTTTTYLWNFGDGLGTSVLANPTYAYATGGTRTVTLDVTCTVALPPSSHSTSASLTVIIDGTAPVLTLPSPITAEATGPSGPVASPRPPAG